jgi:aldose sugar dehydrogenase
MVKINRKIQNRLKNALFALFLVPQLFAQTPQFNQRNIATGLDTPWEILWGSDNHIWVTERYGRISRVNPATGAVIPLLTIADVRENGEGGLLGMVLHPNFAQSPFVYVAYDYNNAASQYREKVVRYTYNGTTLTNPTIILDNLAAANIHNGCRLAISSDLKLFITTGDAAVTSLSQNLTSLNGKTLRLNLDGAIPSDNPIPNSPIWSWGHRNAQGLVFAPSGVLYSSEHGQNAEDEVNIIRKGRNYGWVTVEGLCNLPSETAFCRDSNVVEPISSFSPPLGVAGLEYYNSDAYPLLKNSLLLASLRGSVLTVLKLNTDGQTVQTRTNLSFNTGRLRDVCISPTGRIFVATSNRDTRGVPTADDDRIIELLPIRVDNQEIFAQNIHISPNPVKNELRIETDVVHERLELVDILGKTVLNTNASKTLNLANFTEGVYFLRFLGKNGELKAVKKVVKN